MKQESIKSNKNIVNNYFFFNCNTSSSIKRKKKYG